MTEGGSLSTLTYLGATRVVTNYNVMGVAKASLEASVRYLASEMGERKIRVNAISAGPIKTLAAAGIGGFSKILHFVEKNAPLRRGVSADEVGSTAAFLLSDLASGITGDVIYVDAGFSTSTAGLDVRDDDQRATRQLRRPADHACAGALERPHMSAVVGVVAVLANDHVVAAVRGLRPRVVAAVRAHLGGMQQRFRRHAGPERAGAAEQVAVDDRDRRAAGARVMRGRLARSAGPDDHEIERALGHRSALYQSGPPSRPGSSSSTPTR